MGRALLILVVLAAGVALALWLASVGGSVEVRVGEYGIDTPMPIALLVLALAFLALHGLLSLIGAMRRWPARARTRRTERRGRLTRRPRRLLPAFRATPRRACCGRGGG